MLPASTCCPPYFFTPNRLPSDPLLFRVEPPPRLVALLCWIHVELLPNTLGLANPNGAVESRLKLLDATRLRRSRAIIGRWCPNLASIPCCSLTGGGSEAVASKLCVPFSLISHSSALHF